MPRKGEHPTVCSRGHTDFVGGWRGKRFCRICHEDVLRVWHANNPNYQRLYYARLRKIVFDAYGGPICNCCGETTLQFLTLDHINGRGRDEYRKVGGGNAILRRIIKAAFPPEFQILCFNCNCAKGIHGRCPHQDQD